MLMIDGKYLNQKGEYYELLQYVTLGQLHGYWTCGKINSLLLIQEHIG